MTLSADFEQMSFVEEVTIGVTPATPVFKILPFSGGGPEYAPRSVSSVNISGNRQTLDSALVGASVTGTISADLAYEASHQDLMAAALGGSWVGDVAKVGFARRSFTFERKIEAGTTDQYMRNPGCVINGFSLSVSTGEIVKVSYEVIGLDLVPASAAVAGATYTPVSGNPVFVAPKVTNITIGGISQVANIIGKIDLTISAGARGIEGIGTLGLRDVNLGAFTVKLSYDMYFVDTAALTALKAQTETDISFTLTDSAGKDLTFALGKVKFENVSVPNRGTNTDFIETVSMTGLYDSTDLSSIVITRSAI